MCVNVRTRSLQHPPGQRPRPWCLEGWIHILPNQEFEKWSIGDPEAMELGYLARDTRCSELVLDPAEPYLGPRAKHFGRRRRSATISAVGSPWAMEVELLYVRITDCRA